MFFSANNYYREILETPKSIELAIKDYKQNMPPSLINDTKVITSMYNRQVKAISTLQSKLKKYISYLKDTSKVPKWYGKKELYLRIIVACIGCVADIKRLKNSLSSDEMTKRIKNYNPMGFGTNCEMAGVCVCERECLPEVEHNIPLTPEARDKHMKKSMDRTMKSFKGILGDLG
jgi:hypothetical protein